ncbi:MAG: helix-turn-helix domain-containing protein [Gemmatimonadetes bacterium]|nr:helix-turn-helix domain-containing protein [Gemmatimonadota bacterium]
MSDELGGLGGFRGVRADLLVALRKAQPLTAQALGERFGLTANALRRHLKALEEDGLVRYARDVRGVGAPTFLYSLTPAGEALFPQRSTAVLARALAVLRRERGSDAVAGVLGAEWDRLAEEAAPLLATLPPGERLALVAELLTAEGYMAEVEPAPPGEPGPLLRIHNCAMRGIAESFPEACEVEAAGVARLVGAPVVRVAHRRDGCGRCAYGVGGAAAGAAAPERAQERERDREHQPAGAAAAAHQELA